MKCEICKDPIPKGKEKYAGGKLLCDYCFEKQKKNVRVPTKWVYIKWIMERKNEKKHKKR